MPGLAVASSCAATLNAHNGSGLEAVGRATLVPRGSERLGPLAGAGALDLDVVLVPRDAAALSRFVASVSTPGSPEYRQYVPRGEFGLRFGPTLSTLRRVLGALRDLHLRPGAVSANRLVIPLHTTVAAAERAFHTSLERFRLPSGRVVYGDVSPPMLPSSITSDLLAVVGLDDVMRLGSAASAEPAGAGIKGSPPARPDAGDVAAATGRGAPGGKAVGGRTGGPVPCGAARTTGAATANVLASAYGLPGLYKLGDLGLGETIALFEAAAFAPADVSTYQSCYNTHTAVTVVPVDGGTAVGPGTLEATADVEDLIGLAPRAAISVYETSNNFAPNWLDEWTKIVDDDSAQVVSTSWLECEPFEPTGFAAAEELDFEQAAAQGETVLAATGDFGSEGCNQFEPSDTTLSVDDPASDPYVTGVGGTQWSSLAPRSNEKTWNTKGIGAGGGGISSSWKMPSWQKGPGVVNRYSKSKPCGARSGYCREVPDVSALAGSPYYAFYCTAGDCSRIGGWGRFWGTSFATPLWAASVSMSDEACAGAPPAGFLDPALYKLAASKATVFHDITQGENDYTRSHGGDYKATAAYDLATGLGTPLWSTGTSKPGLAGALCRLSRLPSWLMFHDSAGHDGNQPAESILSPTRVKSLRLRWDKGNGTSPIVLVEQTRSGLPVEVEITSTATALYAYRATTGALAWQFAYKKPAGPVAATSAPAASEATGLVYVGFMGSSSFAVEAVHASTGKPAWKVPWPSKGSATCAGPLSSIEGPLTVAGKLLLGQTSGGCVFALDAATGATVWVSDGTPSVSLKGETAPTYVAVPHSPLHEVVVGTYQTGSPASGDLVALDAATGSVIFSQPGCGSGESTPAAAGSLIVAAGENGLCAVAARSGSPAWRNACGSSGHSSPAVAGGRVFVVGTSGPYAGKLCAVVVSTGKLAWSSRVGAASSPALADGVVYLTSPKPKVRRPWGLLALNGLSGALIYASDARTPVSSPAISRGRVFTGAAGFSLRSGS